MDANGCWNSDPRFVWIRRAPRWIALLAWVALGAASGATAAPEAELSRAAIIFGRVPAEVLSTVQPVFVTNTGDAPLHISGLALSGPNVAEFSVAGTCGPPVALAPGARCRLDFRMRFPSVVTGIRTATATLQTDASPAPPAIALQGIDDEGPGYLPNDPTPDWIDFPPQPVGTAAVAQTITISNPATQTFKVTAFELVGGDAADFTLSTSCPVGSTIAPEASCAATIGFVPTASGPRSTELLFSLQYFTINGSTRYSVTGVGGAGTPPPAGSSKVVEYYNASLDHYFITWLKAEQDNLDAGKTPTKWIRTGYSFNTYTAAQAGTSPVCRYYIPPAKGDSHFFGRGTTECNATGAANPTFVLEDPAFMQLFLPVAGNCPAGTTPIYRVFSNRPDANHRYMTDKAVRDSMVAKGWLAEGDGPDLIVMCAP
jgi:hypothetical protein